MLEIAERLIRHALGSEPLVSGSRKAGMSETGGLVVVMPEPPVHGR